VETACWFVGDDAACLLSAVLQRMQAKGDKVRSRRDTDDAENPAFFFQFVVVKRMGRGQQMGHAGQLRIRKVCSQDTYPVTDGVSPVQACQCTLSREGNTMERRN